MRCVSLGSDPVLTALARQRRPSEVERTSRPGKRPRPIYGPQSSIDRTFQVARETDALSQDPTRLTTTEAARLAPISSQTGGCHEMDALLFIPELPFKDMA